MKKYVEVVEKFRELMFSAEKYLWAHPETGYREYNTSKYMEEQFEKLGYNLTRAGDIPGFYTTLDTGREGPCILVLAELDSLIVPNHKDADKETGYVHACGHHVQMAAILGLAGALKEKGVTDSLSGKIKLCLVPAEELIEIEYRSELRRAGKIKYLGGKSEFLYRGYFDDCDIAFMVHSAPEFGVNRANVGCIAKSVAYKGVSAHAGGVPWNGKNSLYAAMQGLSGANALRETFAESDYIRFHPIITHGGEAVNAIPELTTLEAYVRGASFDAMISANKKINRALCAGALSIGANVEIVDMPGYAPLINDKNLIKLTKEAADLVIPEENFNVRDEIHTGSTDLGDLSGIMPSIHPYSSGRIGTSHGADYYIADKEKALVKSAKLQLCMLYLLLSDNARRAKEIVADFKPTFKSKEEYFSVIDSINRSGDRIVYTDDGCEISL